LKYSEKNSWAISWGILGAAGIQLALVVVLFLYLGMKADAKWQMSPVGVVVGLFVGGLAGFVNLLKLLKYRDTILKDS